MHTAMQTNSHTLYKGSSKKSTKHFYSFWVEWNINLFLARANTRKNYTLAGVAHKKWKMQPPEQRGRGACKQQICTRKFYAKPQRVKLNFLFVYPPCEKAAVCFESTLCFFRLKSFRKNQCAVKARVLYKKEARLKPGWRNSKKTRFKYSTDKLENGLVKSIFPLRLGPTERDGVYNTPGVCKVE